MSADPHTVNSAPRNASGGPQGTRNPGAGMTRPSGPLNEAQAGAERLQGARETTDTPELVHVGWYCWRCEGLVEQPCRSDNVPVSVPAKWAEDMQAEIRRLGEEDE